MVQFISNWKKGIVFMLVLAAVKLAAYFLLFGFFLGIKYVTFDGFFDEITATPAIVYTVAWFFVALPLIVGYVLSWVNRKIR